MQKKTVTFYSEGSVIVADLYTPNGIDETARHPALVQCQGFTGIRDMVQPVFAEYLTEAGYVTLALDYRGWGDSGGERGRMAPLEQVEDVRNALSFLETIEFVDARVKANVGWVGVAHGYEAVTNRRTPEQMAVWEQKAAEARRRRVIGNEVDRCLTVMDIFVDPQSLAWEPAMWEAVPKWRNCMGFDSIARVMDFRPIDIIHRAEGRAMLMILATEDSTGSPASYRELFDAAREPKRLVEVACGHYDMYAGPLMDHAMAESIRFLQEYL